MLTRIGKANLKLLPDELAVAQELIPLFEGLKKATDALSGQDYATSNLSLLYRSELVACLKTNPRDSPIVADFRKVLADRLPIRFPISALFVAAALLDPQMSKLTILGEVLDQPEADWLADFCYSHVREEVSLHNIVVET